MAELKTEYVGQSQETNDENSETDELIRNAYRVIESVRMNRDMSLGNSVNNIIQMSNNKIPSRRQMDIQKINRLCETTDPGNFPQRLHSVSSLSPRSRSQNNCVPRPAAEYDRQYMSSTFVLDTVNTMLNSSSNLDSHSVHDVINLSDVAVPEFSNSQGQNSNISAIPMQIEEEDDVIIVSSNISDIVDLCSPLQQASNQRRRRTPSYRQDRNHSNLTSRRCARVPSPVRSAALSTDFFPQISTTRIQHAQHLDQFLSKPTSSVDIDDSAVAKRISNTRSGSERPILMCPVCMESSVKKKPTSTKCGHVFCASCINQALRVTHKCPMCNTKLNNRMLFRIYL